MKPNKRLKLVSVAFVVALFTGQSLALPSIHIEKQADFNSNVLYNETLVDISVKTIGQKATVKRTFLNGKWHFLSNIHKLTFEVRKSNSSITSIERNRRKYKKEGNDFYRVDEASFIRKTSNGWKWQNTKGDWEQYNDAGLLVSYGKKHSAKLKVNYDSSNKIVSISDHVNRPLLTFTYDSNKLIKVEDYANRKVEYRYNKGLLTEVIDVRGNSWKYKYQNFSTNRYGDISLISERHEPNGRILYIKHRVYPEKDICAGGAGYEVKFDKKKGWTTTYEKCTKFVHIPARLMFVGTADNNDGTKTNIKSYYHTYDPKKKVYKTAEVYANQLTKVKSINLKGNIVSKQYGDASSVKSVWTNNGREKISVKGDEEIVKQYDRWGNLTKIIYPDGSFIIRTYKAATDLMTSEVNRANIKTTYSYDNNNLLIKRQEAVDTDIERITLYEYDEFGQVIKVTTTNKEESEKFITYYSYDDYGNLIESQGPKSLVKYTDFNSLGNAQKVTINGKVTYYNYDNAGNLIKTVSPLGFTKLVKFNEMGYPIEETVKYANTETVKKMTYNKRNVLTSVTNEFGGTSTINRSYTKNQVDIDKDNGQKIIKKYDKYGRLIELIENGKTSYTLEYASPSDKNFSTYKDDKTITTYDYNYWGQETKIVVTSLSDPKKKYTVLKSYDKQGNLAKITTPDGNTTEYSYDELNRNTSVKNLNSGYEIQYTYNILGQITALIKTNGQNLRKLVYDKNGNIEKEFLDGDKFILYSYDNHNRLIQETYPSGVIHELNYDTKGTIAAKNFYKNKQDFTSKKPTRQEFFTSNDFGLISSVYVKEDNKSLVKYNFEYTNNKQSKATIVFFDNQGTELFSKEIDYNYNKEGLLSGYTTPENLKLSYRYNSDSQLEQISLPSTIGAVDYTLGSGDIPTKIVYPNGVETTNLFNEFNEQTGIEVSLNQNSLLSLKYTLNDMGYIIDKSKDGQKITYGYDKFYHLSSVESSLPELQEAFSYDKSGNRLQDLVTSQDYTYENDKLTSSSNKTYLYNEVGDLVEIKHNNKSRNFYYDMAFNLSRVESNGLSLQKNQYDHAGRRIRKTVNGVTTYFLYDERGLLAEYDNTGELIQGYSYLPMDNFSISPFMTFTQSGTNFDYFFYHNDIAHTPQIITDLQGEIVWSADYKSFGEAIIRVNKIKNNLRFPGQYYDEETALHYNYQRFYDPKLGRYLQDDPEGINGDYNPYTYASSMPTEYFDASGTSSWTKKCESKSDNCAGSKNQVGRKRECSASKKGKVCEVGAAYGAGIGASIETEEYSAGGNKCVRVSVCINAKIGLSFKVKCSIDAPIRVAEFFIDVPDGELKCKGPGFWPDKLKAGCQAKVTGKVCLNSGEAQVSGELSCSAAACWSTHCCWCSK